MAEKEWDGSGSNKKDGFFSNKTIIILIASIIAVTAVIVTLVVVFMGKSDSDTESARSKKEKSSVSTGISDDEQKNDISDNGEENADEADDITSSGKDASRAQSAGYEQPNGSVSVGDTLSPDDSEREGFAIIIEDSFEDSGYSDSEEGWASAYRNALTGIYNDDSGTFDVNNTYFSLIYFDGDDIPELVVSTGDHILVYTYENGGLKFIYDFGEYTMAYYSPRNGMIECVFRETTDEFILDETIFADMNGDDLKITDVYFVETYDSGYEYYSANGEGVTEDEFISSMENAERYGFVGFTADYSLTPSNISQYCR